MVEDDKECVIPVAFSCHSRENGNPDRTGSPIRSALLSVEDDKRLSVGDDKGVCHSRTPSVIPAKTGIQTGLDPQSEALRFRLRMTKGAVG